MREQSPNGDGGGEEEGMADAKAERKETKVVDSEEIKRHRE